MKPVTKWICASLLCLVAASHSSAVDYSPKISYIYPAGGQQGTTFRVSIGGQYLRGVKAADITGKGITTKVIGSTGSLTRLQGTSRKLLLLLMKTVRDKRLAELKDPSTNATKLDLSEIIKKELEKQEAPDRKRTEAMLKHPLLYGLADKTLRELSHMVTMVNFPKQKLQLNRQLAETLELEITIAPDAEPGDREIRLIGKNGLTNPMKFQVGTLPEVCELEPNNKEAFQSMHFLLKLKTTQKIPRGKPLTLPVVVNGQIMPGDIDRFRFKASKGQKLVIAAEARSLIPYLADAVPGWFQATMTLYDAKGKKVAYADDFQFNPDPVLYFQIPNDGEYELEIRDSIYRGREDFIYRISIGELPFVTSSFPLGGELHKKATAKLYGWNLQRASIDLNTSHEDSLINYTHMKYDGGISNPIAYMVDTIPSILENSAGSTQEEAQPVTLPAMIDGNISNEKDKDMYSFTGREGDDISIEVYARKLNSPLDSFIRLIDDKGAVVALNDDYVVKDNHLYKDIIGVETHHADSYITTRLPKDGIYYVDIVDSRRHGGPAYSYRLRISKLRPDFDLRTTPSSLSIASGGTALIEMYALRKDGFDGPIDLFIMNNDEGYKLQGATIPAGCDKLLMTVRAPLKLQQKPVALKLVGKATCNERSVIRKAVPADNTMQAFLFRHLVPAQELTIMPKKGNSPMRTVKLESPTKVSLKAGESTQVTYKAYLGKFINQVGFKLYKAPEGLTLSDKVTKKDSFSFTITAAADMKESFNGNLVIEVTRTYQQKGKNNKKPKEVTQSVGFLPAIPASISVTPEDISSLVQPINQ